MILSSICRRAAIRRSILGAVALSLMLMLAAVDSGAQTIDADKAAKLKAAYLLNFVKYAEWPDDAFASPDSPIILTLAGQCDVTNVLASVVSQSEPVGGRTVKLQAAALPGSGASEEQWQSVYESMRNTHLLYVCGLTGDRAHAILEGIGADDVLTVGDIPMFASNGGMIGFVLRGNRIVFEANLEAIHQSRVEVSAKVLQLAQIVGKGP